MDRILYLITTIEGDTEGGPILTRGSPARFDTANGCFDVARPCCPRIYVVFEEIDMRVTWNKKPWPQRIIGDPQIRLRTHVAFQECICLGFSPSLHLSFTKF